GTKLGAQETNFWKMPLPEQMIRVDIDPRELSLNYGAPTLGIAADAQATVDALLETLRARGRGTQGASPDEVAAYKARVLGADDGALFNGSIDALRRAIPREGIIVQDMTMMSYRMNDRYPAYAPRTYLFPSNYRTLRLLRPAAIGAKIGKPGTPVVAVIGDGGFQFTM